MTHQHTEARNHFSSKTRNPHGTLKTHGTPLNALWNPRVPQSKNLLKSNEINSSFRFCVAALCKLGFTICGSYIQQVQPPLTYRSRFLRGFRDPIRVPRISNRVPRIRETYHRVHKIRENRFPGIREIGSLQMQTWFLTFSLEKTCIDTSIFW